MAVARADIPRGYSAEVILDSVSPAGARVTTMVWRYPRYIHAEVMTYRMLSRNTSSSRAIPVERMIQQVLREPAGPVWWGKNQRGMQAREELQGWRKAAAKQLWYGGRYSACLEAYINSRLGLHKQVTNRGLEKWMYITAIITASPVAWENLFRQRVHPDAQPEFQHVARLAQVCYSTSIATERTLHAPLMRSEDELELRSIVGTPRVELIKRVSTARAARVSYLTHNGRRDIAEDLRLYGDLSTAQPPHTSPFEHVLMAHEDPAHRCGNIFGWTQHREEVDPYFIHFIQEEAA